MPAWLRKCKECLTAERFLATAASMFSGLFSESLKDP